MRTNKNYRKKMHRYIWIIEIISRNDDYPFSVDDFCKLLHTSPVTIYRDFQDLRANGIMINTRKKVVKLFKEITVQDLENCFYLSDVFRQVYNTVYNRLSFREKENKLNTES